MSKMQWEKVCLDDRCAFFHRLNAKPPRCPAGLPVGQRLFLPTMLIALLLQSSGATPQVDTWQAVVVAVVSMIVGGGGLKLGQLWLQARRAEHQHEQKMAHLDEGAAAKANALLLTEVQRLAARVAVLEAAAEKHVAAAERWKQAHEECERSKTALLIRVETLEAEVGSLERQVAALKQQHDVAPKPARRPRKESSNATTG